MLMTLRATCSAAQRQLTQEYKETVDWSTQVPLEPESFVTSTVYDALNRPVQMIAPHSNQAGATINVIQPGYNEANLLERMDVWLEHPTEPTALLDRATANPKRRHQYRL